MYLLVRSRLSVALSVAWAATIGVIALLPAMTVPLPNLSGSAPLVTLFVPSLSAACVTTLAATPLTDLERLSARPVVGYIVALMVGVSIFFLIAMTALGVTGDEEMALIATRSYCAYLGIGLIGVTLVGEVGPAMPVLAAATLGVAASPGGSFIFAWSVSRELPMHFWAAPAISLFSGLLFFFFANRDSRTWRVEKTSGDRP